MDKTNLLGLVRDCLLSESAESLLAMADLFALDYGDEQTASTLRVRASAYTAANKSQLWVDTIDVKPIDFDFSAGWGETWEVHPSCQTEPCAECDGSGEVATTDEDDDEVTEECGHCDGSGVQESADPDQGFPMMNFAYPLGREVPDNVGELLAELPLTVVLIDHTPFLALTGGGMDLSWEICQAYVNLGYFPPAHFARLPRMAGRGESEADRKLLAICRNSLQLHALCAMRDVEYFDRDWPL